MSQMTHNDFVSEVEHRVYLLYTVYKPGREAEAQIILNNLKKYLPEEDVEMLKKIAVDGYGKYAAQNRLNLIREWLTDVYNRLVTQTQ